MNQATFPYKRYWYELGNEIPLDENGLMRDPESGWFHAYFEEDVFTIEELATLQCILLLGEPGIGKSTELNNLQEYEATKNYSSVAFDLRNYESKSDLKDSVLNNGAINSWIQKGKKPLSIYLDSLDEALLEARTISIGILDVLKELTSHGQVFTRIACRTSDLPIAFEEELSSLFQNDSLKAVELAPLRAEDIKFAAKERGVEENLFYKIILENELGVLASRPITLNMLLQEYLERGEISDNFEDIYEKGCLYLLENSETRIESGINGDLTPGQRKLIAERIAAVLMLCNKTDVNIGSIKYIVSTDIHINQIDKGKEYTSTSFEELSVTNQAIEETVQTSLFKAKGKDRFSLIHQTFAEFLAAKYLVRNQFTIHQLKNILLYEDGVSRGIIPQLKEVAMWLSILHDEFYMELIDVDPFLLLKSNISIEDQQKLKSLTKSLINHVSERKKDPFYRQYAKYLKHLEFDGINHLLREELLKPDTDSYTKSFILDIIFALDLETMGDILVSIACDETEDIKLRESALDVLAGLKNSTDNKGLLIVFKTEGDEFNQLKAKAIKCLYPDIISSEKVIELINRNENLQKEILKLSGYHILESSSSNDLETLLDWATANIPQNSFPDYDTSYFFDEIILAAIKVHEEPILKKLAKFIFEKIKKRYRLFNSTSSEKSYKKFLKHPHQRRKIVEKIVSIFTSDEDLGYKLRRYQQNLVTDKDFDWVLNHILTAVNEREGRLWAEILRWSFNPDSVEEIERILSNKNNEWIQASFKHWLTPIDIHSNEGKKARKEYEEAWGNSNKKDNKDISPKQFIRLRLNELKEGDIDAFGDLDVALSLKPGDRYYKKRLDFNIEQYPGWISADDNLREEILNHAIDFINQAEPADEDWMKDFRSRSAYRALRLLSIYRPDDYDSIPNEIWEKWLHPFVYYELSDGIKAEQNFLKIFYQKFPEEVVDFITVLIKLESEKHNGTIFITRNIDSILKDRLADSLYKLLNDDELKPKAKETIKDKLLETGHNKVLAYIKANIDRNNEDEFTRNAYLLSKYSPNDFFQLFWTEFEANTDLAHEIIARIVSNDRRMHEILKTLSEEQLANFYIWLEKNYPVAKDPRMQGAVTTRMQVSDFRRYTLNSLVARGTEEACSQMLKIIASFPDKKWLMLRYEEAKEIYRRENWVPVEPGDLLKLAINKNSRLVKNEQDLLQLTIDKLNELQNRLQNQEHSEAIIYWNEDPVLKPKDENRMSDLIKNFLSDALEKEGVILNREVEVERGNKTDIHITALIPDRQDQFSAIKLVIEVKGCWNDGLKTSFEKQLIEKYLTGKGIKTGIYLIGWFLCDSWDQGDYRYNKTPKSTLEGISKYYTVQRQDLEQKFPHLLIREVVLDLTI